MINNDVLLFSATNEETPYKPTPTLLQRVLTQYFYCYISLSLGAKYEFWSETLVKLAYSITLSQFYWVPTKRHLQ